MLNVKLKEVYNIYLKASGKGLNRPYRLRENFDGLDEEKIAILTKLEYFFQNYPTIMPFDFFYAPYVVFSDIEKTVPLNDYSGMRAIDTYKTYLNIKREQTPDQQKQDIRESLVWLSELLGRQHISLGEYVRVQSGYYPEVFLDYKKNKLNVFVLIALDTIFDIFSKIEKDDIEQIFPNYKKIGFLRTALLSSAVGQKTLSFLKNL
jgi:hypothetical protein